jgi:NADP-dependent 3-hydroxy acid dehydrogenase YdfG
MSQKTNQVAFVTRVSAGTGAAIARRLGTGGGYRVAMLARDGDWLASLEAEIAGSKALVFDGATKPSADQLSGYVVTSVDDA